jgi:transcription elongation factor GreB
MNKAFTRESDFDPAAELIIRPLPTLPPGVKNYITPAGAAAMADELRALEMDQRPAVLAELTRLTEAGRQEDKEHGMLRARRQQLEDQIRFVKERIGSFEVVPVRETSDGTVRFGDRVVAVDPDGVEHVYVIVGADEADPESGRVSWATPLGKAFLGAEEGDAVVVQRPRGEIVLEIESVETAA